jgi:hypothetical protein
MNPPTRGAPDGAPLLVLTVREAARRLYVSTGRPLDALPTDPVSLRASR